MKTKTSLLILLMLGLPLFAGLPLSKDEKAWMRKVRILMTRDEEKTFKKLPSHEKRKEFIALFWAKRDPDLDNDRNEFRDEFYARIDYVVANYKEFESAPPKTDRGYVYMLLGPPTRVEYRTDYMITGFHYRNPFPQFQPELWVYENLDFKSGKRTARVQMLPINSFGDYVALADSQVEHLLRTIKFDFIVHPDMDEAPAKPLYFEDYQATSAKAENVQNSIPAKENQSEKPIVSPSPQPKKTAVLAPAPTSAPPAEAAPALTKFNDQLDNALGLTANFGYFYGGQNQTMTMIRFGFPVAKMNFPNEGDLRVLLHYALSGPKGSVIQSDLPLAINARIKDAGKPYALEWVGNLPPGSYTFQMQLDQVEGKNAYQKWQLDVPNLSGYDPMVGPVTLLDPNVNADSAKLKLQGRGYSPMLINELQPGETLYPVVELLAMPKELNQDAITVKVIQADKIVRNWSLYPEEWTQVAENRFIVHPQLRTNNLALGEYTLRIELTLPSGDILIRETNFSIQR